jgi:hypothetical protein
LVTLKRIEKSSINSNEQKLVLTTTLERNLAQKEIQEREDERSKEKET